MAESEKQGLRLFDGVVLVVVAVVGIMLAFWALSFIASVIWTIVKLAILVAVVVGVVWFLMGRRRR
jgi:hypothetical protein